MLSQFEQNLLADCLRDILEAIARITRYTAGMAESDFAANVMVQDAVIFNFKVIGECTSELENHLPTLVAALFSGLPGRYRYPMRGIRAPGCHRHGIPSVWAVIKDHIPSLKSQLALSNDYTRAVEVAGGLFAVQLIDGGWSVSDGPGSKLSAPDERELAGWHLPVRFETDGDATAAILSGPAEMFDIAYESAWTAHCLHTGGNVCEAYGRYAQ